MVYDLNWSSTQTLGGFFSEVGRVGSYWELVLFFEFVSLMIIGSLLNKKSTGYTNIIVWMQLASLTTTLTAVVLMLGEFISSITLTICLVITILIFVLTELGDKLIGNSISP